MPRATLVPSPPLDPSKAPIENVLELTPLTNVGPDLFTNTRPLWHPPGARGIFGGAVIAQALAAAQWTIPNSSSANNHAGFLIHSMHCYFVLPGDATIPVLYSVERVRDGKSFMTRTVQARQRGKCIFTTTASFMREGSAGKETVDHGWEMPDGVQGELDSGAVAEDEKTLESWERESSPIILRKLGVFNESSSRPHSKRTRQWIKARGQISPSGGLQAHLAALAYMSDSYFLGTVIRVQNPSYFARPSTAIPSSTIKPTSSFPSISRTIIIPPALLATTNPSLIPPKTVQTADDPSDPATKRLPQVGIMVSLDHTIYFHRPRDLRADEWLFSEMESPWAGDGRGLVSQRIWNRRGELVASCVQEGLVRLRLADGASKL